MKKHYNYIQIGHKVITPFYSFGKKKIKIVCNKPTLFLMNFLGFAIWRLPDMTPSEIHNQFEELKTKGGDK